MRSMTLRMSLAMVGARRARIFVKQKQMGLIDTDLAPLEPRVLAPGGSESQRQALGAGEHLRGALV